MPTTKENQEILKKTIEGIPKRGFRFLSIEEICSGNSATITLDYIIYLMQFYSNDILKSVDYKAHYSKRAILEDFLEVGLPEYVMEFVVGEANYLGDRNRNIFTPLYEELLQQSLTGLEKKYGKGKVKKLKTRLGLDDKILPCSD